jgi:hypothetical protein
VLVAFLRTGRVERFPTLIACGFVYIAAIQSYFAGLILQTEKAMNRRDFEMKLHEASNWKKELEKDV